MIFIINRNLSAEPGALLDISIRCFGLTFLTSFPLTFKQRHCNIIFFLSIHPVSFFIIRKLEAWGSLVWC